MDPQDYFSFNLTDLAWLRECLRFHPTLQSNQIVMRGRAMARQIFIRQMAELRIRAGLSTRDTLDSDMRTIMTDQSPNPYQITRCDLFFKILRSWLDKNQTVNLLDLVHYLEDIGIHSLAESIRSLYVHFTLPLLTNRLRYNENGQLILCLNETVLTTATPPAQRVDPTLPPVVAAIDYAPAAAEIVGNNTFLVDHIFAFLPRQGQENFRRAGPAFYQNTLTAWRRSVTYRVYTHPRADINFGMCNCTIGNNEHSLNFESLLQLSINQENQENQENQGIVDGDEPLDLSMDRHPVRSLFVSYRRPRLSNYRSEYTPLFSTPGEVDYFTNFGNRLHKLSLCCTSIGGWIDAASQRFQQKLEWLVVTACPNLQYLELNHIIADSNISIKPVQANQEENAVAAEPNRVNHHLNFLNLYLWHTPHFVSLLLSLCPNVRTLYADSPTDLEGLVLPTNNGSRIQLSHLELFFGGNRYNFLRQYVTQFPQTLRILTFHNLDLEHVRNAPFDEYACIGKCVNLTHLTLTMHVQANVVHQWYYDLSQFIFPVLESLSITFSRTQHQICVNNMVRFDFYTLKNLANLQALSITYNGWNEVHRREADLEDDYFYNGQRENFIPRGMTPRFPDINTPLVCTSLRNLEFTCWILTGQDIANFFAWFPNLNKLLIRANEETLQSLPTFAFRLSKLMVMTTRPLSLRHFQQIQEQNFELQILVKIINTNRGDNIQKIVLHNDKVLFERAEASAWRLD